MDYLPIFLDVRNQPVLVVGAGTVAHRKIEWLLSAGADVRVIAMTLGDTVAQIRAEGRIQAECRAFQPADVIGMHLVIAATNDDATNAGIASAAREAGIPVNTVDNPTLSSFVVPAVVNRDPVIVAISSGGHSPVLARSLRNRLESELPAALGRLARFVGEHRTRVRDQLAGKPVRRLWERFVEGPGAEAVMTGNEREAERILGQLAESEQGRSGPGEVYLIGAGPGDPDLLTFRALRLLQRADVVLYDRLVAPGVLEKMRKDAERIYVGKARAQHAMRQQEINQLMIRLARKGKTVARLKGGDPFIFGRGGEEIADLAEAGIPFQVVPGITAASGCATYAGIPLTHRDHASSVRFIAGNLHNEQYQLNWPALNTPGETLVFYMSLATLPEICQQLLAHGKSPDTPVAFVEEGTTAQQRVLVTTLDHAVAASQAHDIHAPALLIMGSVVTLYTRLAWFNPKTAYRTYP